MVKVKSKKRFGQHFLHDKNIINKIIDNITVDRDCTLVEIGPGRGALTFPLLSRVDTLHVIEIDKDLVNFLSVSEKFNNKLVIHQEDALKLNFCDQFNGRLNIIGNLPYNISTPLLFHLLEYSVCINEMFFMVQKEVAKRICAAPGDKEYGRLSIMVQSMCKVQQLFDVNPRAFSPQPKVDSAFLKITPGNSQHTNLLSVEVFRVIVRAAFSKRRKTIRNACKGFINEKQFLAVGIDPSSRPEEISVGSFIELTNNIVKR